jgi:LPS sulfotransferase NodH
MSNIPPLQEATSSKGIADGRNSIVVACTVRSGSNLLCEILERHGYGRPTEIFQENTYQNSASRPLPEYGSLPTVEDLFSAYLAHHADAPWLGAKLSWSQFHILTATLAEHHSLRLSDFFPEAKWIRLGRRKKAAQAISVDVAQQTGVWVHNQGAIRGAVYKYSFERVREIFEWIIYEELMWDSFFDSAGVTPHNMFYEDLIQNPEFELNKLSNWINGGAKDGVKWEYVVDKTYSNQKIKSSVNDAYTTIFYRDYDKKRFSPHTLAREEIVGEIRKALDQEMVTNISRDFGRSTDFTPAIVDYFDIENEISYFGPILSVDHQNFLDGKGICLEPGSVGQISLASESILIWFLAHPWSGEVEVEFDGESRIVDLYHPTVSYRPLLHRWSSTGPHALTLRPLGSKSELSLGTQVWLQRLWSRRPSSLA